MINQLGNILFASLNSTLLFILLLLCKQRMLRNIGARWYYYFWFVLFIPWISLWLPLDFKMANTPHIYIPAANYLNMMSPR